MFKKNINTAERLLRLILAVILFLYAIWQQSWMILIVSLFVFFEVMMSWCVLYQLLGKNHCPLPKRDETNHDSEDKT
ncbi:MAG: DUF2892 domain-containing protein [Parachlamydiaceae bacterium]